MLPFLDRKKMVTTLMSRRGGSFEAANEMEAPGHEMHPDLKAVAEDVMQAIQNKSVLDLAKALKHAFEVCDAEPHAEGEHTNEEE